MSVYETVFKHIDEDEAVSLLQDLVRAPTENPPGDYTVIKPLIIEKMKAIGFDVELIGHKPGKENIIGTLKGTVGKPVAAFYTHIDTVPVGERSSWTVDPFGGLLKDGRVWGRGAADQKNVTAAVLMAAKAIRDSGMKLKGDFKLICSVDEETGYLDDEGNLSGQKYLKKINFYDKVDFINSCVLFGWDINIVNRGTYWIEIVTKGSGGHPTGFSSGKKPINAITKMVNVLSAVKDIDSWMTYTPNKMCGPESKMWTDKPVVETDVINAGVKVNIVPELCTAEVDMRILPGQTAKGVTEELNNLLDELKKKDPELDVEFRVTHSGDPVIYDMKEEPYLLKTARKTVKLVLDRDLEYHAGPSSSGEKKDFAREIGFGPVSSGDDRMHASNESFQVKELMNATKVYAVFICELIGK